MIYFKKIRFKTEDMAVLQIALEKFSEQQLSPGHFQSTTTLSNTSFFFARHTNKGNVNYTRLISRFGRFTPKLIFNVVTSQVASFCRVRLSNRSTGVLILIIGGILANIMYAAKNSYGGLIFLCGTLTVFILFTVLECLQTQLKIKRAILNYKLLQRVKLLFNQGLNE